MTQTAAGRASALEEARLTAATAAARAERRNRPKHLLLLALTLLMFSALLLGWSALARSRASKAYRNQRASAEAIVTQTDVLRRLMQESTDAAGASRPREGESIHNRLSRFQELGAQAGLKNLTAPQAKGADRATANGWVQRWLTYNVKDESLDSLMAWMRLAIEDIHGLEVKSVRLVPEANQWSLNVTFSRNERATGA